MACLSSGMQACLSPQPSPRRRTRPPRSAVALGKSGGEPGFCSQWIYFPFREACKQESGKKLCFLESKWRNVTQGLLLLMWADPYSLPTWITHPSVSACDKPQIALAVFLSRSQQVSCSVSQAVSPNPTKPCPARCWMEQASANRPSG